MSRRPQGEHRKAQPEGAPMSHDDAPPAGVGLPLLTEVVDAPVLDEVLLPSAAPAQQLELPMAADAHSAMPPADGVAMGSSPEVSPAPPSSGGRPLIAAAPAPALPALDEGRIVAEVLAELQRRADQMLEFRLREALAPILARLADSFVAEARVELAKTLRDVVARAVAQEASRHKRQH